MKKIFLLLLFFTPVLSYAQITITSTDVANYFALGTSYANRLDTTTTSVDIGTTGNFALDLSGLNFNVSYNLSSITLAQSGFASDFPAANYVIHSSIAVPETSNVYAFYNVGTDINSIGSAAIATIEGITVTIINKALPFDLVIKLPLTFGTTWTTDYIDSSYFIYTGLPPFGGIETHVTSNYIVDGWGTLTLPGKSIQVLRIKEDSRSVNTTAYNRSINYQFLAQNGESVSISVADTNAATSGVVNVTGISWQTIGTTDIRDDITEATGYRLLNNYPNPFNPSTKIAYYVPTESKVDISIYNAMGEKVKSVFNGINTQGLQELNFNGAGLASGTYFYKMSAVSLDGKQSYSSTGKMLLLK